MGLSVMRYLSRSVAHGGDESTVNVGHWDSNTFVMGHGASYRQVTCNRNRSIHVVLRCRLCLVCPQIVNLGDMEKSVFLNPLGQSGNEFSPLYDNLLDDWYVMSPPLLSLCTQMRVTLR